MDRRDQRCRGQGVREPGGVRGASECWLGFTTILAGLYVLHICFLWAFTQFDYFIISVNRVREPN